MTSVILSGGSIVDYQKIKNSIPKKSFLICADSGYDHALKMELKPDLVVGDMDSVKSSFEKTKSKIYPSEKDETDTLLAIDAAIEKGSKKIILLAATGSRLDHSLANIFLLKYIKEKNIDAVIINENNYIYYVNSKLTLRANKNDLLSIIPLENCDGVTLCGLHYPLSNASLPFGSPKGISNFFTDKQATISLKKGSMLVILAND